MADASTKPKRTWLGFLLRLAVALAAVSAAGFVGAWLLLRWEAAEGRKALDAVVAQLDAKDPGWRWKEMRESLAPIPDAENSALVVRRVSDALGKRKPWEPKPPEPPAWEVPPPPFEDRPEPNRRLDDATLTLLRDELGRVEDAVALAVSLKGLPRGRGVIQLSDDVIGTKLPHVVSAQEAARLLELDAERLLHAGRVGEVPDRVRAILHSGAALRDDALLISAMHRYGIRRIAARVTARMLGMGEPSDAACRALLADLEAERREAVLLPAVRGERAAFHHLFESLASGKVPLAGWRTMKASPNDPGDQVWALRYASRLPEDHAFFLTRITAACDVARLPAERQQEAWEAFEAGQPSMATASRENRRVISCLLSPAVWKVGAAATRDQALLACTVAALAAERHRIAHGRWPEKLDGSQPRDPYTGGPLVYERHEEGVAIRSASEDATGEEVGLRLYDPGRRHRAAER